MDVIRKRTLTAKSRLGFGQYGELTVQEIIDHGKTNYLAWVYFNCSTIDFCIELLESLPIFEKYRIEKPAANPEMYDGWLHSKRGTLLHNNNLLYHKSRMTNRTERKARLKRTEKSRNYLNKKSVLQHKNRKFTN